MPAAALATATATTSFASPGVYDFTVPAGITSIAVTVVGAAGGTGCGSTSGEGASVSATLPATPGELFEVGVGAPGESTSCVGAAHIDGGLGGGGNGGEGFDPSLFGGGGGGASALALSSPSPGFQSESELIVAGGGGGGGQEYSAGGDAGSAGTAGTYAPFGGGGGAAGTQTGGGAGGTGKGNCVGGGTPASGSAGSLGLGGRGGTFSEPQGAGAGGGGGGGYYGGGGGGSGCRGGGGGGGSSFVSPALTVTEAATPTTQPSGVTIAYAAPTAEMSSGSLEFTGTQPQGVASAAQTLTVHNGGEAPLVVSSATLGGADPDDYLLDNGCQTPVAVGANCRIGVRFAPQAQGASTATLTLQTNAPTAPAPLALSGTGGLLPQGPQGAQGVQGLPGAEGPRGAQGSSGEAGAQGEGGTPGAQGAPGLSGAQGVPGAQGAPGVAGSRGAPGVTGKRGVRGNRGAPGEIRLESCVSTAVGAPGHGASRSRLTPKSRRLTCRSRLKRSAPTPAGRRRRGAAPSRRARRR
ncbi:MAG TPA: choice-of-anchor D domain-containing protein [Solirubrobacteraceae bacterium]|jgi:collagen type I/II/III/V/XI/XXIV/XXVII alpha|nr:choice-of-anchor D domain-containing protein [Solirubrobacteraceae bacterium]